jgi:hypothetical protein
MTTRRFSSAGAICSASALTLLLVACGGGNGDPPPATGGSEVVAVAPVLTITNNVAAETATGDVTFIFSFNTAVGTSFTVDDIEVTNGTKGTFTRTDSGGTLVVTPTPGTTGTIVVSVASGAVFSTTNATTGNAAVSTSKAFDTTGGVIPPAAAGVLADFDSATATVTGFDGGEGSSIGAGPTGGGSGQTLRVLRFGGQVYAGAFVAKSVPLTATKRTISAQVYSPLAGIPMVLKLEGATNAVSTADLPANEAVVVGWQTLTWTIPTTAVGSAFVKIVLLPRLGTVDPDPGRTYYFDNITLQDTPAVPPAVAGTLLANFDTENPALTKIGGADGSQVEAGPAGGSGQSLKILRAGGELYAGAFLTKAVPVTASKRTLSARVHSPLAGIPMVVKLEGATDSITTGDLGANEAVVAGWQTLTWTIPSAKVRTDYVKIVLLPRLNTLDPLPGQSYYFDDIALQDTLVPVPPPPTAVVLADFDTISTPPTGFNGGDGSAIAAGPSGGGSGQSLKVLRSGGDNYAGAFISANVSFTSTRRTISAQVHSPAAGIPMVMKIEGQGNATSGDVQANEAVVAGWQTLTWTFTSVDPTVFYNKIVILPRLGVVDAPPGQSYHFDNITLLPEAGGGGSAGTLVFSSGYREGGVTDHAGSTTQGGVFGFFSGDFANATNTFTGGGFANSTPAVADDAQYFYIAVTTSAPTVQTGTPPVGGGYLGMYVTHPGLQLTGQTTLAVNLGIDANFAQQTSNKAIEVLVVGSTNYSNGSGGDCKVSLKGTVTPTTADMVTYTLTLADMSLAQACNAGGFSSGVTTVAQALAQPIGAVNTRVNFPNVNTTINSGTGGASVYATGITRGKTEFR